MSILTTLQTPIFAAEGILHLNRENYQLEVAGLADKHGIFSLQELKQNFPEQSKDFRLTSVSGWSVRAKWNGILWQDFIAMIQPLPTARYALFSSAKDYTTAVLMSDLMASTSMLVWGVDGESLEDEYGGPLRMVIPNLWGYKSCKWLVKIEFVEKYATGYWELRGYSHRGAIEPGETYDVNARKYRPISGGEVTEF
ncbi:molybdopterin-dependent oxidoreductase [Sporomusa sp.]|uniref:molybdopterin-dependent oxidoreductase n=1 Tax=Sporomusa sp. TaxID=2078658 RepID=UPI002D0CCDCC|nr:molybdopterin-dependent oxidoreductase [Sporomusa sp.]HWR43876.1 molybdopterin-dependent oxidoreductase [Sporomusa sp.]